MVSSTNDAETAATLADNRRRLETLRSQVRSQVQQGAAGSQAAISLSRGLDELLLALWRQALAGCSAEETAHIERSVAVIAVGGSGRGEMAPHSDVDVLFLQRAEVAEQASAAIAQVVRACWDTGLKLGHSVRAVSDALQAARQDIHFATSLTTQRRLWGDQSLADELAQKFRRQILAGRRDPFLSDCIAAREAERQTAGGAVLQLEPDVKRSYGGLRDLHLIQWIAAACYGVHDFDSLQSRGALTAEETRQLGAAREFLLALRFDLHFQAGKLQDVLTRENQLRIAEQRHVMGTKGQLPVERFMQEYFRHSLAIAEIAGRFVTQHRRVPWRQQMFRSLATIRIDDIYRIGPGVLDVPRRHQTQVCDTLDGALRLYLTAARYRAIPTDRLQERIKRHAPQFADELSAEAKQAFLEFLATPGCLGPLVRSAYHTGVLEAVLPALRHTRCLLQFNQYHSYTVDEHTLRTIEMAEGFAADAGPVGRAYREIRHKEILHLALLLHDAGKGFEEDHSEVGKRLAEDAATRLNLSDAQRELLIFLVHRHLLMADLAFRRNASDPQVLLKFSHEVGSPETLKLLFVLTAADVSAVGPGVWTSWKADLLTSLYEDAMLWLSGQSHLLSETTRLEAVRRDVVKTLPKEIPHEQLGRFPPHYLLSTPAERIAQDLQIVARRRPDDIHVEGRYEPETQTVAYRIITHEEVARGCFHKLTGVLMAHRLEILAAGICTRQDGVIVDTYQVRDPDFTGAVPAFRLEEIAQAVRRVLMGDVAVEALLKSRGRFSPKRYRGPVSELPLRVVIDNDSSDRYTVVEVFAHDRPGLLYRIAQTMYQLELSVVRAQISTHFDQVVDGFYVTDTAGLKLEDEPRLKSIHDRLHEAISRLEA